MTSSPEAPAASEPREFVVVGLSSKPPHAVWVSHVSKTEAAADAQARGMVSGGGYLTACVCRLVSGYGRGKFMVDVMSGEELHGRTAEYLHAVNEVSAIVLVDGANYRAFKSEIEPIDVDTAEPQTVFVVGMVVYLRGDLNMESPMTVMDIENGLGLGVCWLDVNRQLCTYFTKRAAFATAEELERDRFLERGRAYGEKNASRKFVDPRDVLRQRIPTRTSAEP